MLYQHKNCKQREESRANSAQPIRCLALLMASIATVLVFAFKKYIEM